MRPSNFSRQRSPSLTRRHLLAVPALIALGLVGCAPEPQAALKPTPRPTPRADSDPARDSSPGEAAEPAMLLLASLAQSDEVAVIDPAQPEADAVRRIRVGAAPWGVGVHTGANGVATGYAATAEGLAIVDIAAGSRIALVPYEHPAPRIEQGEYRPGGLGLAVAPDGARVYVAVTSGDGAVLEVIDTANRRVVGSVPVGLRPFDVLVAPDSSWAATVDHDSFTVTVVNAETLTATTHEVAPFGTEGGLASWEKPHYGAVDADGTILLPYQGQVVVRLDPRTGETSTMPSAANSHAHGTALAGKRLLTVGTGAFGNADGVPNLSILPLDGGKEGIVPLDVPHETVALWRDSEGAEYAAIAGGNTRGEGWDGITVLALDGHAIRKIPVPGYPQAIVAFPAPRAT